MRDAKYWCELPVHHKPAVFEHVRYPPQSPVSRTCLSTGEVAADLTVVACLQVADFAAAAAVQDDARAGYLCKLSVRHTPTEATVLGRCQMLTMYVY